MYRGKQYNTFICYRGKTETGMMGAMLYAEILSVSSENASEEPIVPFFAPKCIQKGDDFKDTIASVLEDIKIFIMVLDEGFFDDCTKEDDIVYFEIETALKKGNISFIPICMNGYNLGYDDSIRAAFNEAEVSRLRHLNAINYRELYDFDAAKDVIPIIRTKLTEWSTGTCISDYFEFDVSQFHMPSAVKKISFGEYPQSVVTDYRISSDITAALMRGDIARDPHTGYLIYESVKYIAVTEDPFNKTKFDNGRNMASGTNNYYKVEPIKWILLLTNDVYDVYISERIIDAHPFNMDRTTHKKGSRIETIDANVWEESDIRKWLNTDFLYDAFTEAEIAQIVQCMIDNSYSSSYYKTSIEYGGTIDKIFLISHSEMYSNPKHGCARATDYAKARGVYASTSSSHFGNGDWWTRSPGNVKASVENVDRRGCLDAIPFCNFVEDTAAGVRPVIVIRSRRNSD